MSDEQAKPVNGERYLTGNIDAMLTYSDPKTQQQRSIKLTGCIYSGEEENTELLSKRVKVFQEVLDIEFTRGDIGRMENERDAHVRNLQNIRDQLAEWASRKNNREAGLPKLNSQELQALNNGDQTIAKATAMIADLDAKLAAAKARCGIV